VLANRPPLIGEPGDLAPPQASRQRETSSRTGSVQSPQAPTNKVPSGATGRQQSRYRSAVPRPMPEITVEGTRIESRVESSSTSIAWTGFDVSSESNLSPLPLPDVSTGLRGLDASIPRRTAPSDTKGFAPDPRAGASVHLIAATPKLGTGHGRREDSYVTEIEFPRQQPEPNEIRSNTL